MGVQPSIRQIGKYTVLDVIGTGGMGIVYRAHDPAIGRTVAIKMLRQVEASGGVFDRFFSREMKSTGNLHHRNIVTVYDSGEHDGSPYLVMEFLEGEPISKLIAERRTIPLVEKLDLVIQVCDGLQYAHDRNIIHRDIKPANVILLGDGTAKIVDFGVARIAGGESSIVQTGQLVGSLSYMSPEQINSIPIDARSDVFSTGVMLYELLTFELPFKGNDAASTFVKILREEPPPIAQFSQDFPPGLQAVISRALAKSVNDRYQSAEEFGFDLLSVQRDLKAATIADCMKRAEAAMHRGDLDRVRVHLQEVIRLDRQNERANRLLREVRKAIQQQQRTSQVIQMRSQAQVALAGAQYEEALACADQALRLDPSDTESIRLCEEIRNAISRAKAVREALNRAESALFAGDFDEAKEAIEESLRLDPSDSEARALASVVNKELSERSRRQQVQVFVDQARRGIAERKFSDALEALHRAEELDPSDSNVHELMQWALRGQEQEKRRRYLQEITDQIEKALHAGDFSSACTISDMGLLRFPEEPTLLRLKAISEKQRDIADRRRFVNEQSLAVKALNEQGRPEEAVQVLKDALRKYPGEPNLEALLANTNADIERKNFEREQAERQQRAEAESRARLTQQVLSWTVELKRSLDGHADLGEILRTATQLRASIEGKQIDQHAKEVAAVVLGEVEARVRARDQAMVELDQLRRVVEHPHDTTSISEADNRLLSIKAAFPHERNVQDVCADLAGALSRLREQRDQSLAGLTRIAQDLERVPIREVTGTFRKAREIASGFAGDARVGALLQQIESSVNRRLERHAELLRDITTLSADAPNAHSLDELGRAVDRARSIAALDRTDDELAELSRQIEADAAKLRGLMESLLGDMQSLGRAIAGAATIHEAESHVPQVKALAEKRPDFQELQEAAKRIYAEAQGRRIEHDLIVKELESLRSSVPALESNDDLESAAVRANACRELHPQDPTILSACTEIQDNVERILHERAELRSRTLECDNAIGVAREKLENRQFNAALEVLLAVEPRNPDRADLHLQITIVRKAIEEFRAEQDRQELERIAREKAEAEVRARQAAADQAITEARQLLSWGREQECLARLASALERDPSNPVLQSALSSIQAEIAHSHAEREGRERERLENERLERERRERERIARENAEADARARKAAAERAIAEAQQLLAAGREDESIACLRSALESDSASQALQWALSVTEMEVSRLRAERERLEQARIAREKADADARARQQAAEQAISEARTLLAQGREEESLRQLRSALQQDLQNTSLQSELGSIQTEVARLRVEREQVERERIAKEKAEAEARARKQAAELAIAGGRSLLAKGQGEASLSLLRTALQQDPQNQDLKSELEAVQAEVDRQRTERERLERERGERERLERERIAREKAEAEVRARKQAAEVAIAEGRSLFAKGQGDASLSLLRSALQKDPQNQDLKSELETVQAEVARQRAERERLERERVERERLERERIAREKAEAEARARKAAAEEAINEARQLLGQDQEEASLQRLRSALQRDSQNQELKRELESIQTEVARRRAERERIAKEKAEAEARARKQAADEAIQAARTLLAQGRADASLQHLREALERDPQSRDLRSTLDSIRTEVDRLRAEQERQERERLERERLAKEKAEAEARARKQAAEDAIQQARKLLAKGKEDEAVQLLGSALERDRENQQLRSALESMRAEIGRLRAERERLERERLERERQAKEKAEAEARARKVAAEKAIKDARDLLALGRGDESLKNLRSAIERDPKNQELRSALETLQTDLAKRREEQKRQERDRAKQALAKEKAETEARAQKAEAPKTLPDVRKAAARPAPVSKDARKEQTVAAKEVVQPTRGKSSAVEAVRSRRGLIFGGAIAAAVVLAVSIYGVLRFTSSSGASRVTPAANPPAVAKQPEPNPVVPPTSTPNQASSTTTPAPEASPQVAPSVQPTGSSPVPASNRAPGSQKPAPVASPQQQPNAAQQTPPPAPTPPANPAPASPPPDVTAWNSLKDSRDLNALRDFRNRFPGSAYAKAAYEKMEDLAWTNVQSSSQQSDFLQFLKDYPDGRHAREAKDRSVAIEVKAQQAQLQAQQAHEQAQQLAQQQAQQRDREQVLQTMEDYQSAYRHKDLNGLVAVFPSLPRSKLQIVFKDADKILVTLSPSNPTITGDSATVVCRQKVEIVVHGKTVSTDDATISFSLKRTASRWVIESSK